MLSRWWTYQRERFPLATHVPFALLLSTAAIGWSGRIADRPTPSLLVLGCAGATTLIFLLQLRVADEFKDLEDDRRFRPERPVPRGLVRLRELGAIAAVAALVQVALALVIDPWLLATLGILWAYFGLMTVEFFARRWLKAHPVAYLLSHMLVVPLLVLHVTAFDWIGNGPVPQREIMVFLSFAFSIGLVIELGRKVWAPDQEREGVETYSRLWGPRTAAWTWAVAVIVGSLLATWCGQLAGVAILAGLVAAACAALAVGAAVMFVLSPRTSRSKLIELHSALTAFVLYIVIGLVPRYTEAGF